MNKPDIYRYTCNACRKEILGDQPKWDPISKSWIRFRVVQCPYCGSKDLVEKKNK